jgi:hypothetical protein
MALVLIFFISGVPAFAWGNKGHEVVAYIAYQTFDGAMKARVNALVALNPCFKEWKAAVSGVPAKDRAVAIFMLAATWPDKIKDGPHVAPYRCQPGHVFIDTDGLADPNGRINTDIPPNTPEAHQNIGYVDQRRHKYWHFIDLPFSPDGTKTQPPSSPNAVSEIELLRTAIGTDETDKLKSYDLVWLEHLVGDVHQPLHDTTRFTAGHPDGDQGGNKTLVCGSPNCTAELHAYWDGLPGPGNDIAASIAMGKQLWKTDMQNNGQAGPAGATITNPMAWAEKGRSLAETVAYAPPITDDTPAHPPQAPGKQYKQNATELADSQLTLAGHRLGALIKSNLK